MKVNSILSILTAMLLGLSLAGCEGEKDLIIIDGDLPIKTTTLYMVGDATPNGWSIDAPTPLVPTEDDPLVFTWEGNLYTGEMKLCLTPGSWDVGFIRPMNAGDKIGRDGVVDATFQMHAGDPDEKWVIADAGIYNLEFNLRTWSMSATFLGDAEEPAKEPIEAEALYIVGDATPAGWNIDAPTALEKKSAYVYIYEGPLATGEMKACTEVGSWDVPFVRPTKANVRINHEGVADGNFVYTNAPDNKWKVEEPGIYRLTFDLEAWTITAECTGEYKPAAKLYLIGDATDGGWSWDAATVIEASTDNENLFVWQGELGRGDFKASLEKDFDAPFYRPATADCTISSAGVSSHEMVFTTEPDDKWVVTEAGEYRLTFNTADMTFDAIFVNGSTPGSKPLYMIGDATAGGWSLDNATAVEAESENLYTWRGTLNKGELKASFERDFGAAFYRPAAAGVTISKNGASSSAMVCTTDPDDKWVVTEAGEYKLTFDLNAMTFTAVYVEGSAAAPLYMIGTATAGGWSLDDATEFTKVEGVEGEYTWTGTLKEGTFKACTVKDFTAPFYRPWSSTCTISAEGISDNTMVYTAYPDDQWNVITEGEYTITINIAEMTINTTFIK